ncbi:hypothetical protein [Gordonia phage GTE5]|uniref:Uncharacterized protein n=1 Tax=Gordonia phage GTE5 TaxID=319522 RepID=G8EJU8_9CAUD|nr:hypothetical protein GoPhGTE5p81 [Gordonia phage GTE5]AET09830.1 hypothetical protein [Gordonia phage GTE5]
MPRVRRNIRPGENQWTAILLLVMQTKTRGQGAFRASLRTLPRLLRFAAIDLQILFKCLRHSSSIPQRPRGDEETSSEVGGDQPNGPSPPTG